MPKYSFTDEEFNKLPDSEPTKLSFSDEEFNKLPDPKPSDRGIDFQRPEEEAQANIPTVGSIFKNIGSDIAENVKGVASMITSPIQTAKGATGLVRGAVENVASELYGNVPASERSEDARKALDIGESLAKRVVDPSKPVTLKNVAETVANTAYEKPFTTLSMITPAKVNPAVLTTKAALKAGTLGTKAALETTKGIKNAGDWLAKFGTSQATGINPQTISRILEKPEDFSPEVMKTFTSEGVAKDVIDTLNTRIEELSETGKSYKPIRESLQKVTIQKGTTESVLKKHGIKIDDNGKLIFDKESIPTSPGDRSALQEWYDTFGRDTDHTANSFLNSRKGLDNLAQWDSAKTDAANVLAMDLRRKINEVGHNQINGLKDLDTKFSNEISSLKQVKKDYFNADGTLKDNDVSKISNLTNEGRESVLKRLEAIKPGITEKIKTLKAVKDIEAASGHKVGTYARAALSGAGFATLNPALIVGAALASPKIATQILRGYGKVLKVKDSALNGIINRFSGKKTMGEFIQSKSNPEKQNFTLKGSSYEGQKASQNLPAVKKDMTIAQYRAKQNFQTKGKPYTPKEDTVIDAEFVEHDNRSLPKINKLQIEAPKPVIKMEENRALKTGFRKSPWKMSKEEFLNSYTLNEFVADMGTKSKQAVSKMKDPTAFKNKILGDIYDESVKKAKAEGKYVKPKESTTFEGIQKQRAVALKRNPMTIKEKLAKEKAKKANVKQIEDKSKPAEKVEISPKTIKQLHEEWKKRKTE